MGNTSSTQATAEQYGLKQLVPPPQEHQLDLVFVHGLNGDRDTTWTNKGGVVWPREWLPNDLPTAAVYSYGYPNGATFFQDGPARMTLRQRADNFLQSLQVRDVGLKRPVVLLGHSMGGLVIKQALVIAHELATRPAGIDADAKTFIDNVRGVVFFGTPHRGANLADWLLFFKPIVGATVSADILKSFSEPLLTLNQHFLDLNKTSYSFAETAPYNGVVVVAMESANIGMGGGHKCVAVNENHNTVCKPATPESDIYLATARYIKKAIVATVPVIDYNSEEARTARTQWKIGYEDCSNKWDALMAAAGVVSTKGYRVDNALAVARWVDQQEAGSEGWNKSEEFRRAARKLLGIFKDYHTVLDKDHQLAEAGNMFIFCAPLDAINWKRSHLAGPLYDGVVLSNFGQVLVLLLTDNNKDMLTLGILSDFLGGNREPYSERDLDKVSSQAKDFYHEAQRLRDHGGFSEKELKNLCDFLKI